MCPDQELLSAYIDGEVENPWKDEISRHLEECVGCREKTHSLQEISNLMQNAPEPDYRPSMLRVREVIESTPHGIESIIDRRFGREKVPFWKKQLRIPVPVAAAAAAVIITAGTFFSLNLNTGAAAMAKTKKERNLTEAIPAAEDDLETIIKLMESKDFQNEVLIKLPEEQRFSISGEPQFIKVKNSPGR